MIEHATGKNNRMDYTKSTKKRVFAFEHQGGFCVRVVGWSICKS